MVLQLRQLNSLPRGGDTQSVESLQIASLLALFVSDHFGGSDRSTLVERTRKNISGLNYQKPFVCTCSTGNSESFSSSTRQSFDSAEDIVFSNLCEKSLRLIKAKRNSIIVPIGTLQFGVCRHRALLLKVVISLNLCLNLMNLFCILFPVFRLWSDTVFTVLVSLWSCWTSYPLWACEGLLGFPTACLEYCPHKKGRWIGAHGGWCLPSTWC